MKNIKRLPRDTRNSDVIELEKAIATRIFRLSKRYGERLVVQDEGSLSAVLYTKHTVGNRKSLPRRPIKKLKMPSATILGLMDNIPDDLRENLANTPSELYTHYCLETNQYIHIDTMS